MPSKTASTKDMILALFFLMALVVVLFLITHPIYAIALFVLVIIILVIREYLKVEHCPSCNSRGTLRPAGNEEVGTQQKYKTITHSVPVSRFVRKSDGSYRKEIVYESKAERVPVLEVITRHYLRCEKCGHKIYHDKLSETHITTRQNTFQHEQPIQVQQTVVNINADDLEGRWRHK